MPRRSDKRFQRRIIDFMPHLDNNPGHAIAGATLTVADNAPPEAYTPALRDRHKQLKARHILTSPQGAETGLPGRKDLDMYAVIKTGGKQYRVSKDDVVTIEKVAGDAGAKVEFDQVLMVGAGSDVKVGTPLVAGAKVTGEVVEQTRGPKLIAFKKRRRKNSRRKKGHRQDLSTVRITSITGA